MTKLPWLLYSPSVLHFDRFHCVRCFASLEYCETLSRVVLTMDSTPSNPKWMVPMLVQPKVKIGIEFVLQIRSKWNRP